MDTRTSSYTSLNATTSTPQNYYTTLIVQRLNDLVEAWESYYKNKGLGIEVNLNIVHARTNSIFLALLPYIKRKSIPIDNTYKILFEGEPNEKQLLEIFTVINTQLDIDKITRMDNRRVYDNLNPDAEDDALGY